jgi:hypothetical protein
MRSLARLLWVVQPFGRIAVLVVVGMSVWQHTHNVTDTLAVLGALSLLDPEARHAL